MRAHPPPEFGVSSSSGSRDSCTPKTPRARNSQTLSRGRVKRFPGSALARAPIQFVPWPLWPSQQPNRPVACTVQSSAGGQ